MDLQYIFSKNNEKTFIVNSIFYHSSYNPSKEAERFLQTNNFIYSNPDVIIIIEPGFSYLYKILKERFPDSKIGIIRLFENFNDDFKWDFELSFYNIENQLKNNFTELELLNCELITWPTSLKIFNKEITDLYIIWKNILEYSKTLLTTRQYFEKKWLINSVKYFLDAENQYKINLINQPVLITASGPSLFNVIKIIQKNRNKFFLLALSSSYSVLQKYNIVPDSVMTTDGGYWAQEHLKYLPSNIPIICSSESYFNRNFLKNHKFITLKYEDGISSKLIDKLLFPSLIGERNGTVSGTALKLIQNLTNKEIFFVGLDLSFAKGFQHTQPNILEINNSLFDYKVKSKEIRIAKSEMNKSSLDIYRNWFSNLQNISHIYRINDNKTNTLGKITDLSSIQFENKLKELPVIKNSNYFTKVNIFSKVDYKSLIYDFIFNEFYDYIIKEVFPGDYLSIKHNPQDIEKLEKLLKEKKDKLYKKIERILNV